MVVNYKLLKQHEMVSANKASYFHSIIIIIIITSSTGMSW